MFTCFRRKPDVDGRFLIAAVAVSMGGDVQHFRVEERIPGELAVDQVVDWIALKMEEQRELLAKCVHDALRKDIEMDIALAERNGNG